MQISKHRFNQAIAASFATFGGFGVIFALTWSATALPSLEETGQVGPLSYSDKSWIASLVNMGAMIACPIACIMLNHIGRKWTLVAFAFVGIPGWMTLAWATHPFHLYIGRFMCGISAGGCTCSVSIPVYIREISSKDNRGALASIYFLVLCIGKVFSNGVGIIFEARDASKICALQPIIFIVLLLLIPETPTFLAMKNKTAEAVASLSWLHHKGVSFLFMCSPAGYTAQSSDDHSQITTEVELMRKVHEGKSKSSISLKRFITSGELLKPSMTAFVVLCMAELCGIGVMSSYTVQIFAMIGDGPLDPKLSTVVLAGLQTICCIPASLCVDRYGRKSLFLSSYIVMTLSMFTLFGFFYIQNFHMIFLEEHPELRHLSVFAVVIYNLAYCWGVGNIAFVTLSELLPQQVVGPVAAAATGLYWAAAFTVTKSFQTFQDSIPNFVWFATYSVICGLGGIFTLVCLPETKGLSFQEIQQFYKSSKKQSSNKSDDQTSELFL